jgi:hypothetical protein
LVLIYQIFIIYQPDSRKWKTISADIGDTGLFVQNLFVTSDGSVWGKTVWDTVHRHSDLKNVPVLSKFNENTQRFEFAKGILKVPFTQTYSLSLPWPNILLAKNNIFWIFANGNHPLK